MRCLLEAAVARSLVPEVSGQNTRQQRFRNHAMICVVFRSAVVETLLQPWPPSPQQQQALGPLVPAANRIFTPRTGPSSARSLLPPWLRCLGVQKGRGFGVAWGWWDQLRHEHYHGLSGFVLALLGALLGRAQTGLRCGL